MGRNLKSSFRRGQQFLIKLPGLILEELLRQQILEVKEARQSIELRIGVKMPQVDRFQDVLKRMEKQGLIWIHDGKEGLVFHATIKGLEKARENRQIIWKAFPPPPQEPDSKS